MTTTSTVAPHATPESAYKTSSWKSPDGEIEHYVLERPKAASKSDSSVLFLSITNNEESWGRNPAESQRTIYNHLELVTNTTLAPQQVSLGILTSTKSEFEKYKAVLTPTEDKHIVHDVNSTYFDYAFARVVLVLHTADTRNPAPSKELKANGGGRKDRHNIPQHERRAILAKLRNYITSVSLAKETHVAWLDSDVYQYNSDTMIEYMMERTTTTPDYEVGILTSRCRKGEQWKADAWLAEHPDFKIPDEPKDGDTAEERKQKEIMRGEEGGPYEIIAHKTHAMGHYDLNAWAGIRKNPTKEQLEGMWKDISSWTPSGADNGRTKMLDGLIDKTNDEDLRMLDSVGGTILMINADLIRMGLIWPTGYFIAMSYEHGEGYDGIESEGLCLVSRSFSRNGTSMCFTLGGEWSVWHTIY